MKELPLSLKKHLRERVEAEVFPQHKQFIKCTNHLGEIKWLTDTEIDDQHEFYPHHSGFLEKISKKERSRKKIKIPKSAAVDEYIEELKEELTKDIEKRLIKDKEKREQARERRRANRENGRDNSEDDKSFQAHPDYKLYENHLGERRWLTAEEYENQDEFTLEIVTFRSKIFTVLKWVVPAIIVLVLSIYTF